MLRFGSASLATNESLPDLGPRLPLLGGRLTMAGLLDSKLEARSHDLMSADRPDEEETRVVLVPGDENARFVALAQDRFVLGTGGHTWQSGSQSFESEAIVALDEDQKLHVFVSGSQDDLAKLRKSAESMRKVPHAK